MKSCLPRSASLELMAERLLAARDERSPGATPRLTPQLVEWLAQLSLLYGVPLDYLVPDERLLPVESIRFFYLDRNWLDRLIDGAFSLGAGSTLENTFNESFFTAIYEQIDEAQAGLRAGLRGRPELASRRTGGTLTGFFFRSQVVTGWPGLEVEPLKGEQLLPILRLDHLGNGLLLGIFDGVPDRVRFIEPSEGLHFGVLQPVPQGPGDYYISLRGLGFGGYGAGVQIGGANPLTAKGDFRTHGPAGVLDIAGLVANIQNAMPQGSLGVGNKLEPAGFAIQMVRGAGRQTYSSAGSFPPCGPAGRHAETPEETL